MQPPGIGRAVGQPVPALADFARGLFAVPSACLSIAVTWLLVQRWSIRRLKSFTSISEHDAKRLFSLSGSWLALLLISWTLGSLGGLLVLSVSQSALAAMVWWTSICALSLAGWWRSLYFGVRLLSRGPVYTRMPATIATRTLFDAVAIGLLSRFVFDATTFVVLSQLGYADSVEYLTF